MYIMAKKIARLPAKSKTALKKIITVKNADGDPDTTATIVIQNKIKYIRNQMGPFLV